jgi:peptidoglycan/xylan/chitin deacetylase (PgdA/CDA1 family)
LIWIAEKVQSRKHQEQTDSAIAEAEQHAMQVASHEEDHPELEEPAEPEVVDEVRQKILKLQESLKQI